MVIVDKLSNETHFIAIKSTYKAIDITQIFIKEIIRLYGVPKRIILDIDANFTSKFWKSLFVGFGT